MNELAGTRPESISRLQWFALVTIAGAIFLNTAPYIGLLTNTPNFDKHSTIAKAPPTPAAHVVARAEVQTTKPESVTGRAWIQPRDASAALEEATAAESAPSPKDEKSMTAEALPVPHSAPKQGSARPTFTTPPLPVPASKQTRSAISRSEAPPLPTRAPKEVRPRIAGIALQQTGRASWYTLDSPTANGENMDDAALTAAHNFLPFGTKVLIENIANGRSVVVRINDRGPFVAGRIIDLSKAAAEALEMIADGVADVRLSVIYDTVASAGR
jgi:peptidoglycan lytic transglycosylase